MTASAQITLVEAKLFPGGGTQRPLPRPRLDPPAALLAGQATVASVVAPAGYGKSTLLAHWFQLLGERDTLCAWLSLDEDDNDPARLLRYLVGALQTVAPEIGADATAQLDGPASAPKLVLESLAADLGRVERRIALFLDDLHCLHNAEALQVVEWLLNYAPKRIQFLIGSREDAKVRLGGLRVRGSLFELSQHDLTFDYDEARRFCQARLDGELSAQDLMQLVRKTEGWPAGLELAALALQGAPDREQLIEAFAGSDQSLIDYLGDVVLSRLDETTRCFLFQAAQFDRIGGALARAATGNDRAETLLAELQARNLFLIALDRRGEWFRFHQLVGEYFRRRYRMAQPQDCAAVLLRGAQWLQQRGHTEDAINAAIRAEAWEPATQWLAETVEDTSHRLGYHQMVLRWMHAIPHEWMDRYPTIRINYALSLLFATRLDQAQAQVRHLERLLTRLETADAAAQRDGIDTIRCALELQQVLAQALGDEGRKVRETAQHWLERWPQAAPVQLGSAWNSLAFGHKSCGDIDAGLQAMQQGRRVLQAHQGYYGLAWSYTVEAFLLMKRGAYGDARRCCQAGLELLRDKLDGHRSHASVFEVILAAVAYEFDETEQALRHLEVGLVNLEEYGTADVLIMAWLTQARLQFLQGNAEAGYASLQAGREAAARRGLPRVEITLATEECGWRCRSREFDAALALAGRYGIDRPVEAATGWDMAAEKASRSATRLLLHSNPASAVRPLESALRHAREKGLLRRQAELLLLLAAAQRHAGAPEPAAAALGEALQLGTAHGYRRLFLDDAAEVAAIAQRGGTALSRDPAVAGLLRSLLEPAGGAAARPVSGLVEELTKRELKILRQLDSGLSNREIAESIFISEGTLKWHLHNIYGKLGSKNRSGALAKARSLGLLGAEGVKK
ncbi:winged helix-turn-helix transcriptional regulator [Solimonas sp. K1W22B-7]|uniref:LuxR C-terminal-related transcriptional regulator n=1 Tax=Solimonas sp. K1W22B-7 TaxID=2303331 RepID=UPI000E32F719|nr:LuxR C-terminal-related transcriptional regulator [Solimonas sp. K1W22B-7]AXQ28312.1 winged helix-turn-helix transcriptional regulator [Solimonas sp. K1W22B-7]